MIRPTPNADTHRRRQRGRRLGQPAADEDRETRDEDRQSPRRKGAMDRVWEGKP